MVTLQSALRLLSAAGFIMINDLNLTLCKNIWTTHIFEIERGTDKKYCDGPEDWRPSGALQSARQLALSDSLKVVSMSGD